MQNLLVRTVSCINRIEKTNDIDQNGNVTERAATALNSVGNLSNSYSVYKQIDESKTAGVDLLVFPETTIGGYFVGSLNPYEYCVTPTHTIIANIQNRIGSSSDLIVGVGVTERGDDYELYNAYYLIGYDTVRVQRKIHVVTPEHWYWRCGNMIEVFDIPGKAKIAISICADNSFPQVWQQAADKGAEVILSPFSCGGADPSMGINYKSYLFNATPIALGTQYLAKLYEVFSVSINNTGYIQNSDGTNTTQLCNGWGAMAKPDGSFVSNSQMTALNGTPETKTAWLYASDLTSVRNSTSVSHVSKCW